MKGLSCNSNILSALSLEEAIEVVAELGYQAIDINAEVSPPFLPVPPPHLTPAADVNRRRKVRRCAEEAGVVIAALNGGANLIHGVPETRQANLQAVKRAVELASDLGVPYVVLGGGHKDFYGRESQYWEWLVAALRELVAYGSHLGVTIAVEAGSLPGRLVHNLDRMRKLLSYSGLERLGVLFDPGHYHVRGDSVVAAYSALSERVVHVHAKDARGNAEDFEFPPLGMGEIDFEDLLGAMVAANYPNYIAVEYEAFAWGYETDAKRILSDSKYFLEGILSSKVRSGQEANPRVSEGYGLTTG